MLTLEIIDLNALPPLIQCPTFFKKFDALEKSGAFVIKNSSDPKAIFEQLQKERNNAFEWEYLEAGPEHWMIKVTKNNLPSHEASIGELVAEKFQKADVFKKYKIDFCCGGKKTLSQVCKEKHLDYAQISAELKAIETRSFSSSQNYNDWDPGFLADYILHTHHHYVKAAIPLLLEYTRKVAKVHGHEHPEVITVAELFAEAAEELLSHLQKEEAFLFPYIQQLVSLKNEAGQSANPPTTFIQNPIRVMEHEHDMVGGIFKSIRELSSNYTPPVTACATYKVSYSKLQEFEEDLHQHIHLENNILFPKSILLEQELFN